MHADPMMDFFAEAFCRLIARESGAAPDVRHAPDTAKGLYVLRLVDLARSVAHDDFFGLAAAPCPLGANRFMHDLAVRGTTLREGLSLAFQFMGFACPAAHFRLTEDDSVATIEIEIESNGQDDDHLLIQWQMLTMHKLAQWQTGSEIVLDHVTFPNAMQAPYGDYAVMFGGKCEFNAPVASLSFAAHNLDLRIVRTPADLDRQFNAPKGNFAEPKTLSKSWQQRVKRLLRSDLSAERPLSTIDDLADEFRISSQTLRRRLKHEGTSYRELKADVRREAALDAMSGEDAPLSQASLRAGFAEANGLTRALRTSAGLSSTDLRGQVRAWRAH